MANSYSFSEDRKFLGTAETLSVILEHRKILSECVKYMDAHRLNYISEHFLFEQIKKYTELVKTDVKRRIHIALSSENLIQAHIVMDIDRGQGESRLYFQESVIGVVRLCDISLFKRLTDVQLKTHLGFLNQAHKDMRSGIYNFSVSDDDYIEFIDNLLMNLGQLLSNIRQNVSKMQSVGKDLEKLTSDSMQTGVNTQAYIQAKEQWLEQIVKLYERHIMPVLEFLNPDTQYAEHDGLHAILVKIRDVLYSHQQDTMANNIQSYIISLLNYYQPIENTAEAVNRFIHKERDSIKRFNAIEYFYQSKLMPALQATQSDNLNKRLLGNEAIIQPNFSPNIKPSIRPQGYGFSQSSAYFKNMFNELEARVQDLDTIGDFSHIFATSFNDEVAVKRQLHYEQLLSLLDKIHLRQTDDLLQVIHKRLQSEFVDYQLYDLISALQHYKAQIVLANNEFVLKQTNRFAIAESEDDSFKYRRIRCLLAN